MDRPESPDMLAIGADCNAADCRQHDFLPFKCDACQEIFCLEHRTYQAHNCSHAAAKQAQTIVCPLCAKAIKLAPGDDANAAFAKHSSEACDPQNYARVHAKPKCPCAGCRERLTTINAYRCKDCGTTVCLKHRFPADHDCASRRATAAAAQQQQNPLAAAMRSALGWGSSAPAAPAAAAAGKQRGAARKAAGAARTSTEARQAAAQAPARQVAAPAARAAAEAAQRRMGHPQAPRQQEQSAASAPERCPQCGEGFATLQELLFHVDAFHPADGLPTAGAPERCPHCSQAFRDAIELVAHVERNHSQQLNKVCVVS